VYVCRLFSHPSNIRSPTLEAKSDEFGIDIHNHGADFDWKLSSSTFREAIARGHFTTASQIVHELDQLILERNSEPRIWSYGDEPLLFLAARENQADFAKTLLERASPRPDVNEIFQGQTALYVVAEHKAKAAFQTLLLHSADSNILSCSERGLKK
jgi:hypothetical protein